MNIESVKSIFTLFSGEDASEENFPVIVLAVDEVKRMLRPDTDETDVRLEFLAAALANYRLCRIKSARDRTQVTYAGKYLKNGDGTDGCRAEMLLRDHIQLCEGLISPTVFVFSAVSGREELL